MKRNKTRFGAPAEEESIDRDLYQFVLLSKGQTCFQLKGEAKRGTVVLVHGLSIPMFLWDPTAEFLVREGFRVLRFDLYGRGRSARPSVTYDYSLFVGQLRELVDHLGLEEPFVLFGTSMGAPIAASFAAQYPKRVSRIILSGPVGFGGELPLLGKLFALPRIGEGLFTVALGPILKQHVRENFLEPDRHPEIFRRISEQTRIPGFARAMLSTIRNSIPVDMTGTYKALGRLSLPVLMFLGRHDREFPLRELLPKVSDALPRARTVIFEESSHLPHYEEPGRANAELATFCAL